MRVENIYYSSEQMFCHLLAKHYKNDTICLGILQEIDPLNIFNHLDSSLILKTRNELIKVKLCISEKMKQSRVFRSTGGS